MRQVIGSCGTRPNPRRNMTTPIDLPPRAHPWALSLLLCVGCGATAQELAGRSLRHLAEEPAMEAAGLQARAPDELVCEECQRQLMHQP